MIDQLIEFLKATNDANLKAIILQSYISSYGPVPDDRGEEVRQAMEVEHDQN